MKGWKIPASVEREVLARDTACVSCGVSFTSPRATRGAQPTWEHIVNDLSMVTSGNILRCCMSCNASKGARALSVWLQSRYCARHRITASSVATIVQEVLRAASVSAQNA